MMGWFSKKKATTNEVSKSAAAVVVPAQPLNYHPKIILAWAKAIEGNKDFVVWLKENGYEELAMATYAIYLKVPARDWLIANGFPHLMAMINAAEGNAQAQNWLVTNGYVTLYHIAMAVEDDQDSWDWLGKNVEADVFLLTQTIKKIKDKIEENHNDVHSFGRD